MLFLFTRFVFVAPNVVEHKNRDCLKLYFIQLRKAPSKTPIVWIFSTFGVDNGLNYSRKHDSILQSLQANGTGIGESEEGEQDFRLLITAPWITEKVRRPRHAGLLLVMRWPLMVKGRKGGKKWKR